MKWRPFCLGLNVLTHWPLGNFNEILYIIFKPILVIDRWGISFEIAIIWLSLESWLDFTNDQSILVQVMAWCSQWVGVGGFSKVVATFNHVGGSFNLFMATTGDVWIIPSFRIWDYVLHVVHISCVITNSGQHQWVIPSALLIALQAYPEENTARKLLSWSLDLFFKILLFQVTFLILFSITIFSPYFLQVDLLWLYFGQGTS